MVQALADLAGVKRPRANEVYVRILEHHQNRERHTLCDPLPSLATQISPDLMMFNTETAADPYVGNHPVHTTGRPRKCVLRPLDTGEPVTVVMSHDLETCTEAGAATRPDAPKHRVSIRRPQLSLWRRAAPPELFQGYIEDGEVLFGEEE
jgi:hypothetical protein